LRRLIKLLIITCLALPVACGEQSSAATSPSPTNVTAIMTLTNAGCQYAGPSQMRPGQLIVHLVDQTSDTFWLGLGLIQAGHTYSDLAAWIDADRARELSGAKSLGPPDWSSSVAQAQTSSSSSAELKASLVSAGTYAFACGRLDLTAANPERGAWAVGPLTVST